MNYCFSINIFGAKIIDFFRSSKKNKEKLLKNDNFCIGNKKIAILI